MSELTQNPERVTWYALTYHWTLACYDPQNQRNWVIRRAQERMCDYHSEGETKLSSEVDGREGKLSGKGGKENELEDQV